MYFFVTFYVFFDHVTDEYFPFIWKNIIKLKTWSTSYLIEKFFQDDSFNLKFSIFIINVFILRKLLLIYSSQKGPEVTFNLSPQHEITLYIYPPKQLVEVTEYLGYLRYMNIKNKPLYYGGHRIILQCDPSSSVPRSRSRRKLTDILESMKGLEGKENRQFILVRLH